MWSTVQVLQGLIGVLKTTSVQRDVFVLVINKASQLVTSGANVKGSLWKVNGYNPVQLVLKWETLTGKK